MKKLIESTKDFKIIPNNFKSAGAFNLVEVNDNEIVANLSLVDESELEDYKEGENVEIFAVNNVGLIYFETKILKRDNLKIHLALSEDFSIIQRREYSRVGLKQGNIIFNDISDNVVLETQDISAGGLRLITNIPLELDKEYSIEISLSGNMKIDCMLKPIRVEETTYNQKKAYIVSGKFSELENMDRIVLVQYAFKIKMEEQNKEND